MAKYDKLDMVHIYKNHEGETWFHTGLVADCPDRECKTLVELALRQQRDRVKAIQRAEELRKLGGPVDECDVGRIDGMGKGTLD